MVYESVKTTRRPSGVVGVYGNGHLGNYSEREFYGHRVHVSEGRFYIAVGETWIESRQFYSLGELYIEFRYEKKATS